MGMLKPFVLILACLVLAVAPRAWAAKRVALVIGNSEYEHAGRLRNPVHDAQDMAAQLRQLGFDVTLKTNLAIDGLDDALSAFAEKMAGARVALFWYGGHGLQYKGESYLVPVDAQLTSELSVRRKTIAVADIISQMEGTDRVSLIFLDACRNNPLAEDLRRRLSARGRAVHLGRGLGRIPAARGETLIVYSAAPDAIADDGAGRNSPFAKAMLRNMKTPGLEIGVLLKRVRRDVRRMTHGRQRPEWLSRLETEFRFKQGAAGPEPAAVAPPPFAASQSSQEVIARMAYNDARGDIGRLEDVARRFSGSIYGDWARRDAQRLKKKREEARRKARSEVKVAIGIYPQRQETRRLKAGETFRDCTECPQMVVIPAGSFTMGSPASEEGRDDDEGPQRRVTIAKPFAVGRFEVTFDEWDACVADGGCGGYRPEDEGWGRGRRPVINVSWHDAKAYLKWLSGKTGKDYRLLSEAEWEYAARAGTTTAYHWGDRFDKSKANNNGSKTVPAGRYGANAFGLYDMHGNVWEWVEDCYHYSYNGAPVDGTAWTTGRCGNRVLRGGSWDGDPHDLRSALRTGLRPADRVYLIGFRVARSMP